MDLISWIGISIIIFSALLCALEIRKENTKTKKKTFVKLIIFNVVIIAILSVANVFFQNQKDLESSNEEKKQTEELLAEYKKLQEKSDSLQSKSDKIIKDEKKIISIQSDLIAANKEIISLQGEINNQIVGGGIIPNISPSIFGKYHPNDISFHIGNLGMYPVYDVSVSFEDLSYFDKMETMNYEERQNASIKANKKVFIGTIASRSFVNNLNRVNYVDSVKKVELMIRVSWRYGNYQKRFVAERNNEGEFRVTYWPNN